MRLLLRPSPEPTRQAESGRRTQHSLTWCARHEHAAELAYAFGGNMLASLGYGVFAVVMVVCLVYVMNSLETEGDASRKHRGPNE